jgi:hypothetical protein
MTYFESVIGGRVSAVVIGSVVVGRVVFPI